MPRPRVTSVIISALVAVLATSLGPANAHSAQPQTPTLVDIRAAQHPTYDRLVFEFTGLLPEERDVRFVSQLVQDGSGLPLSLVGDALLQVRFSVAVGHDDQGQVTYGPLSRTYALPNLIQVRTAGDFEGTLTFGVGLAKATSFQMFTLTNPSRVVIDIDNQFPAVPVQVFFIDNAAMQQPRPVSRPVIPPATARGALQRLFAGPTASELADGLVFVDSEAGGFASVSITDGVARVQLTDNCDSHGSTITVANQIMPTLKQFPSVQWVKIFEPAGTTQQPTGNSDSIPTCLEP